MRCELRFVRRTAAAGGIALGLVLLAGCDSASSTPVVGSPGPTASSSKAAPSCAVVTSAEIGMTIGYPVDPPQRRSRASGKAGVDCLFSVSAGASAPDLDHPAPTQVEIVVGTDPDSIAAFSERPSSLHTTQVSGLGDRAYQTGLSGAATLHVLKGSTYIEITVASRLPTTTEGVDFVNLRMVTAENQIATYALPRL